MLQFSVCSIILSLAHMSRCQLAPRISLKGARASQSSTFGPGYEAVNAIDGNRKTSSKVIESITPGNPWWMLELGGDVVVYAVVVRVPSDMPQSHYPMFVNVGKTLCKHSVGFNPDATGKVSFECVRPITSDVMLIRMMYGKGLTSHPLVMTEVIVHGYRHIEPRTLLPIPKMNLIGLESSQSSPGFPASRGNDGDIKTCTLIQGFPPSLMQPWWRIRFSSPFTVTSVKITNNSRHQDQLGNVAITVDDKPCGPKYVFGKVQYLWVECLKDVTGKELKIQLLDAPNNQGLFSICEVEVWAYQENITALWI